MSISRQLSGFLSGLLALVLFCAPQWGRASDPMKCKVHDCPREWDQDRGIFYCPHCASIGVNDEESENEMDNLTAEMAHASLAGSGYPVTWPGSVHVSAGSVAWPVSLSVSTDLVIPGEATPSPQLPPKVFTNPVFEAITCYFDTQSINYNLQETPGLACPWTCGPGGQLSVEPAPSNLVAISSNSLMDVLKTGATLMVRVLGYLLYFSLDSNTGTIYLEAFHGRLRVHFPHKYLDPLLNSLQAQGFSCMTFSQSTIESSIIGFLQTELQLPFSTLPETPPLLDIMTWLASGGEVASGLTGWLTYDMNEQTIEQIVATGSGLLLIFSQGGWHHLAISIDQAGQEEVMVITIGRRQYQLSRQQVIRFLHWLLVKAQFVTRAFAPS